MDAVFEHDVLDANSATPKRRTFVKSHTTTTPTTTYHPYHTPAHLDLAKRHGKAKRVYLSKKDDRYEEEGRDACVCCGLPIEGDKIPLTAGLDKIYHLGSGFALYFQFIKFSIGLLVLLLAVSGIFSLITNANGGDCERPIDNKYCAKGYILSYTITNKRDDEHLLQVQLYLNLATVLLIMLFFHFMRYSFRKTIVAADDKTVTPSDYTIVMEGIPPETTDDEIKQWLNDLQVSKDPLKIQRIIRPHQLGSYIKLVTLHHNLSEMSKEEKPKEQRAYKKHQQKMASIQKQLHEAETKLKEVRTKGLKRCSIAYVTFEKAQHAHLVELKFQGSLMARILGAVQSRLMTTSDHFKGIRIKVKRAPEPTDILWENLEYTPKQRANSRLYTNIITIISIGLSFGLILLINWAQAGVVKRSGKGSMKVQVLSIVSSLVITLTNIIMGFIIYYLTRQEKHLTFTNYLRGVAEKLSAAQFINTALANLFAKLVIASQDESNTRLQAVNIYNKGGLLETMYWVFIVSAIQAPAFIIFDMAYVFKLYSRFKASKLGVKLKLHQKDAHLLFEGSNIPMPARFATLIKIMLLTTFYAPAVPIAAVFTIGGLILWYWAEKYNLLRRSVLPNSIDDELADSMVEYLEWAACTFAIGNIIYVFSLKNSMGELAFPHESNVVIWVTFGISLFHIIFPMGLLNKSMFPIKDEVTENQTYEEARLEFQTDYDIENPITRKKALQAFLAKIQTKKTDTNLNNNKGFFSKLNGLNDLIALGDQKRINTESDGDSLDFDFLDMYANQVREQNNAPEQKEKLDANTGLENLFKLNKAKEGNNIVGLKNLFPVLGQKESPDDEPSVNHDHLDADIIKPSHSGTRSRGNTRRNSQSDRKNGDGFNDNENYSPSRMEGSPTREALLRDPSRMEGSPTREALLRDQGDIELKFFLSPILGQNTPRTERGEVEKAVEQSDKAEKSPSNNDAQRRSSIHKHHS